jgi:hypothetical protein
VLKKFLARLWDALQPGSGPVPIYPLTLSDLDNPTPPQTMKEQLVKCPACNGSGRYTVHSTSPCSSCQGAGFVPAALLARAEKLADECLKQNPRTWPKKREWARAQAVLQALSGLAHAEPPIDEADEEELDEQVAEGLHEWINESYDNRH